MNGGCQNAVATRRFLSFVNLGHRVLIESGPVRTKSCAVCLNSPLWAVTTYFNPAGFRRRLTNYRVFRARLPIPLLTVELAFDGEFQLCAEDADRLVQRRTRDVMWQKERLLKLAFENLPEACRKVMWLDCDLIYCRDDWPVDAARLLDEYPVIQGYRRLLHLDRDANPEAAAPQNVLATKESLASQLASNTASLDAMRHVGPRLSGKRAIGFAWGARREVIEKIGVYDACIAGGGDRAFVCAAFGCFEAMVEAHSLSERRAEHYLAWAKPAFETLQGRVGFMDADLLHLWHGDLADRGTHERHRRLAEFGFDPYVDIAPDPAGCWRWSSPKTEMHAFLRSYFESRKEDG